MKKQFTISIFLLCSLIVAMMSFKPSEADNILSESEKKEGWKLLFDGKTMSGWRNYKNQSQDSWEVVNGQMHIKMGEALKHCDLITKDQYQDFELTVDWKVDKGANSGIIYHSLETHGASYETGPEYQLIDDAGYPGKLEDWQKSGADYGMHAPLSLQAKPVGEYNHTRILVQANHVEHWLNGIKVVDFETGTPEWQKLKSNGKWRDYPDYGRAKKGYLALQDHGGGVWFKNLKVRKL